MKKFHTGIVLSLFFAVGAFVPSALAVYYDYYGNRYETKKDFRQNYLHNNQKKWTSANMVNISFKREPERKQEEVKRADVSQQAVGTLMRLESTVLTPPACPSGWEEKSISSAQTSGDISDHLIVTRTCYTDARCSVIEFEERSSNWDKEPALCPLGWQESALTKVRRKEAGTRYTAFIRTCFVCQ